MEYTEDQKRAIEEHGHNILVAAAAGSGKTRVLVDRIVQRLLTGECNVDELLVVTFTNAAAMEMRERIEKALRQELAESGDVDRARCLDRQLVLLTGAHISTFHVFCQRLIRQHIELVDADPQFRLAGEQEMALMKRDVLEDLLEEHYQEPEREGFATEEDYQEARAAWHEFLSFVDDYGDDKGDEAVYQAVLQLYEFSQSQPEPETWLMRQADGFLPEQGAGLWETSWGRELWQQIVRARASLERQAAAFEQWLAEGAFHEAGDELDRAALSAALAPYSEVLGITRESLGAILQAGQDWQELRGAVLGFVPGKLSSAKIYRPLKNDYPELRAAFDNRHDALKKSVKVLGEKYFQLEEEELLAQLQECGPTVRRYARLTLDFCSAFRAAKQERRVLDFNDLEHYALQILKRTPDEAVESTDSEQDCYRPGEVALELQQKFKEVMVDEYQDTNSVQEAILSLIAPPRSRFVVGDVKQSIYRFRLANPYLFQRQYESFPLEPGEDDDNQLITMGQNFRSRAEVLAPINFFFDQLMCKEPMEIEYDAQSKLYPGAAYPEPPAGNETLAGAVELDIILSGEAGAGEGAEESEATEGSARELKGFELEAQHIAQRIARLIEAGPMVFVEGSYRQLEYRDIAVLLRAVTGKADILLEVLRRNSIPAYADVSGGYFEVREVRLVLDLLAVVDNARQDIPLAAVLASPLGGFSMKELGALRLAAKQEDFYTALLSATEPDSELAPGLRRKAADFQQRLAGWRSFAVSHSVPELIWKLYRETGYYDYVGSLHGGLLRQANLRMLADRAAEYEQTNYRGLFRFLRFIEELQKRETDLSVARTLGASENVVRIMSVHKSKGLEFPVVIMADLGKKFNLTDARGTFLLHQELGIGPQLVSRSAAGRQRYQTLPWQLVSGRLIAEAKAEELRVLYVALTRAREKLILVGNLGGGEDKAAKQARAWCAQVGDNAPQLSVEMLANANTFLDWLAPAAARHRGGRALRELAQLPQGELDWGLELEPEAELAVQLVPGSGIAVQESHIAVDDPILLAVQKMQPLPETGSADEVREILGWQYEELGLAQVQAKLSVTEIKQMFTAADELDAMAPQEPQLLEPGLAPEETVWRRPRFLQEQAEGRQGLTATERGTLLHLVMQHLDFTCEPGLAAVEQQLKGMQEQGLLQDSQAPCVDRGRIVAFLQSPMGQRLRHARRIYRELPFSRLLPAKRFYSQVQDEGATVFLQGIVDVVFEDSEGRLVLLDYKTDRDPSPEHARERYRVQIMLYSEAISTLWRRQLDECYIYLWQSGQAVPMS